MEKVWGGVSPCHKYSKYGTFVEDIPTLLVVFVPFLEPVKTSNNFNLKPCFITPV